MDLSITTLGYLTIPLGIFCLARRPIFALVLAILWAPFPVASVINLTIGDGYRVGLQPGYYFAGIFTIRFLFSLIEGGRGSVNTMQKSIYRLLFIFIGCVIISTTIALTLFSGVLIVYPPRLGLDITTGYPLSASNTNISQILYLLALCFVSYCACLYISGDKSLIRSCIKAYIASVVIVLGYAIYEILGNMLGWPALVFLFDNPVYDLDISEMITGYERLQKIGPFVRAASTFSEPSTLAQFCLGAYGFVLCQYLSHRRGTLYLPMLIVVTLILLFTVSTTAYLGILIMTPIGFIVAAKRHIAISKYIVGLSLLMIFTIVGLRMFQDNIVAGLDLALKSKSTSRSFESRINADLAALKVLVDSIGIGAGWGSNRSSSLIPNIASNAGVAGLAIMFLLARKMYTSVRASLERASSTDDTPWLLPICMTFIGSVVGGLIAVPDTSVIHVWLAGTLLVGMLDINWRRRDQIVAQPGSWISPWRSAAGF
jgi:hypothetical protein